MKTKNQKRVGCIIFISSLLITCDIFSQNIIDSVSIELSVTKSSPSAGVKNRIIESVRSVSEKAIVGRRIDEVISVQASLQKVLEKVFNETLKGYFVSEVKIKPDKKTIVYLTITPKTQVVESVKVKIDLSHIHPYWQRVLDETIPEIAPKINPILIGIPVGASDWAVWTVRPIIEAVIQTYSFFPGFDVEVDLEFGPESVVLLRLRPRPPIIRHIGIDIQSQTMPNLVTQIFRKELTPQTNMLIGLPVEFVKNKQDYLRREMSSSIKKGRLKRYRWVVNLEFKIKEDTEIIISVESLVYQGGLEGLLNLGVEEEGVPDTEFRVWIGKKIGKRDSICLRTLIVPRDFKLIWQPGVRREFSRQFFIGMMHQLDEDDELLWTVYKMHKLHFEWLHNFEKETWEVSLGYWLKSFVRIDLARKTKVDAYLRLILNF